MRFFVLPLLGITLALAALEMGMRSTAWVIVFAQAWSNPRADPKDPAEFRIVALGESTTAQFWSKGRVESWPGQLERNLNAVGLGRRFKVINLAKGGTSTPFLVAEFERRLPELRPNAVISMMGINDSLSYDSVPDSGLGSLRIMKLARWLVGRFGAGKAARRPIAEKEADELTAFLERDLSNLDKASAEAMRAAKRRAQAYADAQGDDGWYVLRWASYFFFGAAQKVATDRALSDAEAKARSKDLALIAFELAERGLKKNPVDPEMAVRLAYADLIVKKWPQTLELLHEAMDKGLQLDSTLLTLIPPSVALDPRIVEALRSRGLRLGSGRDWYRRTAANYRRLATDAEEQGIAYLAMQYPTGKIDAIKNIFAQEPEMEFDSFASSLDGEFSNAKVRPEYGSVIFVGNENFNALVGPKNYDEYFTDRFAGRFGHATSKGQALIARNAARAFLKNWRAISKRAAAR